MFRPPILSWESGTPAPTRFELSDRFGPAVACGDVDGGAWSTEQAGAGFGDLV
jgi:hypothetical protein